MNWKTFFAMLARDVHVARRNFVVLLLQTFLQPLMFVFPGIMAISMVFTGVWAVAMPLIAEFQFTREIEDRLLAPMEISWVAVEKVLAGTLQALIAGLVVIPAAWVILRPGVAVSIHSPFTFACVTVLVALFSACGGLALGCSVNQQHIGLMFSMVLTPMIFFGCTYYPWSALNSFPILQKVVLVNPLVYASEGLRGTLVPQFPHLPLPAVLVALTAFDALLLVAGLRQFWGKAVS
jgi:ABC-2 type transport system permease protein